MAPLFAAALCLGAGGCERAGTSAGRLEYSRVICGIGAKPGRFFYPRAIDSDSEALWVIDKTARVQRISPKTGDALPGGWRMPDDELGKPTGVTIAPFPDGREAVYVADTHYHRVMVYDADAGDGEHADPLASFGEYGYERGQFIYTTDVAVLKAEKGVERVFVREALTQQFGSLSFDVMCLCGLAAR